MGEVCNTSSGGTPSRAIGRYYTGNIPWVKSGELNYNVIETTEEKISEEALENSSAKIIPKGTLLIAMYGATVGRLAILGIDAATNQAVCAFEKSEFIVRDYLYHYLSFSKEKLLKQRIGGAQPNISQTILNALGFPLSPLPEQHRIVEKLERLFARLSRAEAALAAAETALECYRQSVLNTAFKAEDEEGNLKEGWKWVTVKEVGEVVTGTTPSTQERKYYGDEYPFYKPTDLEQGFYTESARDYLSELGTKAARMLPPKSILVTCIGATIGKTGFSRKEGSTNQQINSIIPNKSLVPEFGYFFVISDFFQKQIKENASSTTLPILNKSKFEKLPFVLPPSEIQNQIVLQIETAINRASSMHLTVNQLHIECTRLRQSILQEAFGGRLVPQVPSDEPASTLLSRIKAAREQLEKSNKQRGKSPSKNIEKKMAKVKEGTPILDILRASDGLPVKAQTVWLQSEFKDNIDKFYEALKVLIEVEKAVKETREGDITYLTLSHEN